MRRPFNGPVNITQEYGATEPGSRRGYHTGVDYAMTTGTPIYAPEPGTVTNGDGRASADGRGYFVLVQGDSGTQHCLYHLNSPGVASGKVAEGQLVGYSGATGKATGPHLHWETRHAPYDGNSDFPPANWLFAKPSTPPPADLPAHTSAQKLYLPAVPSWRVYPLNKAPVVGNESGKLAPAQFGGLTYDIVSRPNANVAIIDTRDFGRVQIWIAPDTGAVVK